jgi:hypothetical protein
MVISDRCFLHCNKGAEILVPDGAKLMQGDDSIMSVHGKIAGPVVRE